MTKYACDRCESEDDVKNCALNSKGMDTRSNQVESTLVRRDLCKFCRVNIQSLMEQKLGKQEVV